jgi:hypothetical protein
VSRLVAPLRGPHPLSRPPCPVGRLAWASAHFLMLKVAYHIASAKYKLTEAQSQDTRRSSRTVFFPEAVYLARFSSRGVKTY